MAVTSEIMDVILAATDALRQIIDTLDENSTEGDIDTSDLIDTLDALMAGGGGFGCASSPGGSPGSGPRGFSSSGFSACACRRAATCARCRACGQAGAA